MSGVPPAPGSSTAAARLSWWRLALWFGLLAGLGEVISAGIRKLILHRFIYLSRDVVWMAPLMDALLYLLAGACLAAATRLLPALIRRGTSVLLLAGMAATSILLMYPALHQAAALLLGLGVGAQVSRMAGRNPEGFARLVGRTLAPLAILIALIGAGSTGTRAWRERSALAALPAPAAGAPNVLLVVWDTVRHDNLSLYGYTRPTSPHLDRLAREGIRFDHALATAPWTLPSHASMFTGLWPHEHGADWRAALDGRAPVLAEAFAAAGYRTGGFAANLIYCSWEHGLARGFSRYQDHQVSPGEVLYSASIARVLTGARPLRRLVGYHQELGFKRAADVNRELLSWLARTDGRPFFAFLNLMDAHVPRLVPRPYDRRFGDPGRRALRNVVHQQHNAFVLGEKDYTPAEVQADLDAYDGAIAYEDRALGDLLESLRRRGLLDKTIVVVTSDHGELFREHGLYNHGNSLYRQVLEVPLVIAGPSVPRGKAVSELVSLRDLPATLVALTRLARPPSFPGGSLARFWEGGASPDVEPLLAELTDHGRGARSNPKMVGGMRSVVLDGIQYIRNGDGSEELYDLSRDPAQADDLAARASDVGRYRNVLDGLVTGRGGAALSYTPATAGTPDPVTKAK